MKERKSKGKSPKSKTNGVGLWHLVFGLFLRRSKARTTSSLSKSELFPNISNLRLLFFLRALLDHQRLKIFPIFRVLLLEFHELQEVLGREFAELALLLFQNFLEFVDLKLAEFGNGLDDAPLFIACEGDAATQEREEHLFVEGGLRVRGRLNSLVRECGSDAPETIVFDFSQNANVLVVIPHLFGRNGPRGGRRRAGILRGLCSTGGSVPHAGTLARRGRRRRRRRSEDLRRVQTLIGNGVPGARGRRRCGLRIGHNSLSQCSEAFQA